MDCRQNWARSHAGHGKRASKSKGSYQGPWHVSIYKELDWWHCGRNLAWNNGRSVMVAKNGCITTLHNSSEAWISLYLLAILLYSNKIRLYNWSLWSHNLENFKDFLVLVLYNYFSFSLIWSTALFLPFYFSLYW